eukprot:TRINITY_DN333_c0_g1_i1.p1 TRINITY_DN333_c0_g1~~TRINITY_DN333_c0_g1_i1.p1  ORF type:complete len:283 (+),score=88.26 TRINITY_DN333_c0_g1_i1:71-850(+)
MRAGALLTMAVSAAASGCGDCWCVRNVSAGEQCPTWQPPKYSADTVAKFGGPSAPKPTQIWRLADDCNPYKNSSCTTVPAQAPEGGVCAVMYNKDGCNTYTMKDFVSADAAAAAGYAVTHEGACGLCSTLQDLASYMTVEDMTKAGKKCAIESLISKKWGMKCFEKLGMTEECSRIWMYDAISDSGACGLVCVEHLTQAYNLPPDCRLNACLQCDEDKAGPLFKRFAARTRRRSGLISAIQRPCSKVARLQHHPCNATA